MAVAAQTLINRVRTYVRDWPPIQDVTTASVASTSTTTISVADSSIYTVNAPIQIDTEAMVVTAIPGGGVTLTVRRGARGTTAATHANGATILLRPDFFDQEILDAINGGIDACFPYVYKDVSDTSLTIITGTYEYTVPALASPAVPIPRIWKVETKTPGDLAYRRVSDWIIATGSSPQLKFRDVPYPNSTVRISGYAPFPHLAATDTLDAQWPATANELPVLFAVGTLLASGEAGRVRQTSGAVDDREQANRTGSSSAAGRDLLQRFKDGLLNGAHCSPMMAHIVVSY